jgi:Zn-dependent peptidase ImmA (M78 family)
MYKPTFNTNARSLPILSRAEIDQIGENLVADFNPEALREPTEIDVDRFITRYLGMEQDFQYLSHCGLYLGMTVFNDSDRVTVFNAEKWQAEYISVKAGTVIIDNSLLADNQEHRYRFTAGHEAAHKILHTDYFAHLAKKNPTTLDIIPMVQCRADTAKRLRNPSRKKSDADWMEWQANCLSSSILMPRSMVIKAARRAEQRSCSANAALEAVIRTFNVSSDAAYYRLQELNLVPQRNQGYRA